MAKASVEIARRRAGVEEGLKPGRAQRALAVEIVAPGGLALRHVGELVELGEARGHARLDGALAQQVGAEGVDGAGEQALEPAERDARALAPRGIRLGGQRAPRA